MNQQPKTSEELKPVEIDANSVSYGRIASQVASFLLGKDLPTFSPNRVVNRPVIVKNLSQAKLPLRKNRPKVYFRHSRYPGSLKTTTFTELAKKDLKKVFIQSVRNMLPNNRLRTLRLRKLSFKDEE